MSNWAPHSYKVTAIEQGCAEESVTALIREGNRLHQRGLPVVFTLGHLAHICGVPFDLLDKAVKRKSDPYRKFRIRKRGGGYRLICVPEQFLLTVQQWIHQTVLRHQPISHVSMAFAPNCGHRRNAELHCKAKWLVKIDVASFFESISERQVYYVFRSMGFPALLSFQFGRLCTRVAPKSKKHKKQRWKIRDVSKYKLFGNKKVGHLPQGAPTSPMLANLVCRSLDRGLVRCAEKFGCMVSRYADDIVYSSDTLDRKQAGKIIERTSKLLGRLGLVRRHGKTHVATPGSRRVVTGLLINTGEPRLPRAYKERILLHLFHAKSKGVPSHCEFRKFRSLLGFRAHLDGLITYAEYIEPTFGAQCRRDFELLGWRDLSSFAR